MLALSLLVTSRSHIFTSFFKIFLMICLFGLFHGLIMLPVILCLFGPTDTAEEEVQIFFWNNQIFYVSNKYFFTLPNHVWYFCNLSSKYFSYQGNIFSMFKEIFKFQILIFRRSRRSLVIIVRLEEEEIHPTRYSRSNTFGLCSVKSISRATRI